MPVILQTTLLLAVSNVFMLFAWYAHLRNLSARPWYLAVVASWSIDFLWAGLCLMGAVYFTFRS